MSALARELRSFLELAGERSLRGRETEPLALGAQPPDPDPGARFRRTAAGAAAARDRADDGRQSSVAAGQRLAERRGDPSRGDRPPWPAAGADAAAWADGMPSRQRVAPSGRSGGQPRGGRRRDRTAD